MQLIDGKVCVDHVHMYVANPSQMCVSEFMSYLTGESPLMLFDRHPEYRANGETDTCGQEVITFQQ